MALTLAMDFWSMANVFWKHVRRNRAGNNHSKQQLTVQRNQFTIVSMTISLAACFIPLVFMRASGALFREFAVTIVIAILASGVVSLT